MRCESYDNLSLIACVLVLFIELNWSLSNENPFPQYSMQIETGFYFQTKDPQDTKEIMVTHNNKDSDSGPCLKKQLKVAFEGDLTCQIDNDNLLLNRRTWLYLPFFSHVDRSFGKIATSSETHPRSVSSFRKIAHDDGDGERRYSWYKLHCMKVMKQNKKCNYFLFLCK